MSRPAPETTRPRSHAGSTAAQLLGRIEAPARRRKRIVPEESTSEAPSDRSAATSGAPNWAALEPRGLYARCGRPLAELVLLAAVLPFAVALALPIALVNLCVFGDPRRILFSQERVGHRGQVFRIHKFRTMKETKSSSFDSWSGDGDALRVTAFGRFLRNSHLDELPQLLNVLKRDMSVIGPRPEMVEIETWAGAHVPKFVERLAVRPGITGWPQITQGYVGRCAEGYAKKHALCMQYLERFGPKQDALILVRTVLWMARRQGWQWQDQGRG
ncbi:UDP-N-acetylgalactosamine-undecaprenyl-phosphate N-acetylgalactosaminephosphotransferase [Planctomycetes bacterium Pla163]|uniref:UDP-N-acetylgalactosamine-undecaprenyl-phosphate N-acetylgalactosaminephosphotransferase n=1 Tax=Rohdeia mirabilis TaxID=2528008 RepID=A0A518D184_9BACT|nr:UDP-N-acetylgalactosamine-undecaprenyl-phosphate N-acetylgalactosaminephosphotransferase [Planctomycetes bacterium Pla163]